MKVKYMIDDWIINIKDVLEIIIKITLKLVIE